MTAVERRLVTPLRPPGTDTWVALSGDPLPSDVAAWAVQPSCGALVSFCGTARDHAEGRPGVQTLTYEAYEEVAVARLADVAAEARRRWPMIGRVALLHRTGQLEIGDVAVLVAVAAPHRAEAFDAARFCIDTVKAAVPIWKRERWEGGDGWGTDAHPIEAVPSHAEENPASTSGVTSAPGQRDVPSSDTGTTHRTSPVDS